MSDAGVNQHAAFHIIRNPERASQHEFYNNTAGKTAELGTGGFRGGAEEGSRGVGGWRVAAAERARAC